ncbi:MAG: aspartate aminotransferase family protein [Actinomycetota bacterium]
MKRADPSIGSASALMPTYRRYPVTIVRGEGLRVFDDRGRSYLDFAGGIACIPIGHSHPAWVEAVQRQAAGLTHVSNLFATEPQERLAERLVGILGFGQVFLCNSGAEANEAALKVARRHGRPKGRTKVVALSGSFHGRTFATLAATGQPEKHTPFQPLPEGFVHIAPNDSDALDRAVDPGTAAVLMEPVLGEGGVLPLDEAYLRQARELCDERGALLILDEVQTGVGRCGAWYAHQRLGGIRPDVVTSAKALAGGLPIGAAIARPEVAFGAGEHATTFGGGPVVCAAALAVLDVIEKEGLVQNAAAMGERLLGGLREAVTGADLAEGPRGLGLLVGAPVGAGRSGAVVAGLMARGFLATEAGPGVVRATPPLTVDVAAIDAFVDAFGEALRETLDRESQPAGEAAR